MTIQFTVANSTTGEILRTGDVLTVAQANLQGGTSGTTVVISGADPVAQKVSGGTVVSRPAAGITCNKTITAGAIAMTANGTDTVTFSGIGNPSTATITPPPNLGIAAIAPYSITTDPVLSITTTVAGAYTVKITNFPNVDFVVTLNAS